MLTRVAEAIDTSSRALFEPLVDRHRRIVEGSLAWEEFIADLNEHIRRYDPVYKGIAEWHPLDHTRIDADRGVWPPFLGLYKDTIDVVGYSTRLGSTTGYRQYPGRSARFVELLESAGPTCMGKAVTLEFGLTPKTFAVNPRFPDFSPGGSSTGSGVVVAAGFCDFSIGTDAGGSIRHPAGQCGVTGMKLTFNPAWHPGVFPNSPSMDSVGLIARSAADLRYLWEREQLSGVLDLEPAGPFKAGPLPTIGIVANAEELGGYDPEVWENWVLVKDVLTDAGFELKTVDLPWWSARDAGWRLLLREVFVSNEQYRVSGEIDYDDFAWRSIELGEKIDQTEHDQIRALQEATRATAAQWFASADTDLLLLPLDRDTPRPISTPPPEVYVPSPHGDDAGLTILANLCHLPAFSLPTGVAPSGAPLACQIWGPMRSDATLLRAACLIEQTLTTAGIVR